MATTLPPPGDPGTLYLVDLSGYVFRAYYAVPPLSNSRGEPTNATYGVTSMLLKLVNDQQPAYLAVALDSRGRSFRHEMFEEYKSTRRAPPEDLSQQIGRLRDVIDAYAIPAFQVEAIEADDLIATVVQLARERGMRVVIVSGDKDMLQLVGDGVVMLDTMRDKVYGPEETKEKMGVWPHQVRDLLALTGDSSDNIPGVAHVGPKTAQQLLEEFGTLEAIYAQVDGIKRKALRENLIASRDNAFLSQKLVTLRADVPIELDLDKLKYGGADEARLRELFTELEFGRLLNQLKPPVRPAQSFRTILEDAELVQAAEAIRRKGSLAMFTALDGPHPMRAALCGLGLSWEDGTAAYLPLSHRYLGVPKQLPLARVLEVLGPIFADGAIRKVSGDVKQDEVVLARHGVALAGAEFDVMLGSYLLDPEKHSHDLLDIARAELKIELLPPPKNLGEVEVAQGCEFAAQRADAARLGAELLRPRVEAEGFAKLLTDVELPLAHVLATMERTGVRVDTGYLAQLGREVEGTIATLERKCKELAGKDFNVSSPRQLEGILFDDLKLPVIKRTKTGRSTDADVLEELAAMHELPSTIVEHRVLSKLKSTYLDALPREVLRETGRVHTVYKQAVAATGRLSSTEPNLQNIPIRTDFGRKIRDAFIPAEGWVMMSADYSQIELRILAHMSKDPELVEAFTTNEDVHIRTARALFNVDTAGVTREMRGRAKTVNFAVIYGQTEFALARNLRIPREEARRYIDAFFVRYAGVRRFLDSIVEQARQTGAVRTILGRRRLLHDMHSRNRGLRMAAERVACNTPIQGSAADIMKVAMVRVAERLASERLRARMLLTVHDELVFEVPPDELDRTKTLVRETMATAVPLDVPLLVDAGTGKTWGEAH